MWLMRWSRRSCSRRGPVRMCLSVILFERRGVLIKSDALGHRYGTYPLRCQTWELPLPAPQQMSDSEPWLIPLLLTSCDHHWTPVQTWSLEHVLPTLLVLTSSGTHPSEMLCCLFQVVFLTGALVFIGVSLVAMFWKACVHVCTEDEAGLQRQYS